MIRALALWLALAGLAYADTVERCRTSGNGDTIYTDQYGHRTKWCHTYSNGHEVCHFDNRG